MSLPEPRWITTTIHVVMIGEATYNLEDFGEREGDWKKGRRGWWGWREEEIGKRWRIVIFCWSKEEGWAFVRIIGIPIAMSVRTKINLTGDQRTRDLPSIFWDNKNVSWFLNTSKPGHYTALYSQAYLRPVPTPYTGLVHHVGYLQGKLHMWVDIFPRTKANIPPPSINISPSKPEKLSSLKRQLLLLANIWLISTWRGEVGKLWHTCVPEPTPCI